MFVGGSKFGGGSRGAAALGAANLKDTLYGRFEGSSKDEFAMYWSRMKGEEDWGWREIIMVTPPNGDEFQPSVAYIYHVAAKPGDRRPAITVIEHVDGLHKNAVLDLVANRARIVGSTTVFYPDADEKDLQWLQDGEFDKGRQNEFRFAARLHEEPDDALPIYYRAITQTFLFEFFHKPLDVLPFHVANTLETLCLHGVTNHLSLS